MNFMRNDPRSSSADRDPFAIDGPALISFSGGRTSAYMLWRILEAHGGELPDQVHVTFANTGKEREETLRFVHECGSRWGVPIQWLEYRDRYGPMEDRFAVVGYNSASRAGEPFAALVADKSYTPNAMARFCTVELKVRVMKYFAQSSLGWTHWNNVIGLRHDEGSRCLKAYARNAANKEPFKALLPLDKGRIAKADVMAFWARQPFDLGLRHYEGNCDLCFLKSRGSKKAIIRENPGVADWWIAQEKTGNGQFVTEYSVADLAREVAAQPHLFDELGDDEHDAECGLWCGEP
jgi:3'-phosphoadenosine 5'-phosphosulfate sulfotransferase (PAPS reductase)/FAD synthetase